MNEFNFDIKIMEEVSKNAIQVKLLGEVKRNGIVITCNQEVVDSIIFGTKEFTKEELINLRNHYVKFISDAISIVRDNPNDKYIEDVEKINALMTVITGSIDKRLYQVDD